MKLFWVSICLLLLDDDHSTIFTVVILRISGENSEQTDWRKMWGRGCCGFTTRAHMGTRDIPRDTDVGNTLP